MNKYIPRVVKGWLVKVWRGHMNCNFVSNLDLKNDYSQGRCLFCGHYLGHR